MSAGKVNVLAVMDEDADFIEMSGENADDLRQARAAVAELVEAAKLVMAKHDAEAVRCNFSNCGCDYCFGLRPVLAKFEVTP